MILIACEESQRVCCAFRKKGIEAFSCDLLPCSGGRPEWHIKGDVTKLLAGGCGFQTEDGKIHFVNEWKAIIAFPPCTYLSNAGANHLFKGHVLNEERYKKGLEGKAFFMLFYNLSCPHCVENPVSSKIYEMPKCSQEIEPWQFGNPVSKKTRLWIKGLPLLKPTYIVKPLHNCHEAYTWFTKGGKDRQINRAKTFIEIAEAMADQWGEILK